MIEVINRQRRHVIDEAYWTRFSQKALAAIEVSGVKAAEDAGATIAFVSDRVMRDLNRKFRGHRGTTDVLSFPEEQHSFEVTEEDGRRLGDIVISVEKAAAQASKHQLTLDEELAQLILHGLLHVSGYDHEADDGEMNQLELALRRRLKI